MKRISTVILLTLLYVFSAYPQFNMMPPVSESGYGLVRTNVTAAYDHTFGAVPDNLYGRISYQFLNKPYLKLTANTQFNMLWANFKDNQLNPNMDAWGISINGNHIYGSFGFTAMGFLPLFGKPLALLCTGNAEWSSHCFGRISGLVGAAYIFKMTKDTQIGAGPLVMLNTASKIPVFPIFILRHRFNDRFAVNVYGGLFGMEYKLTDKSVMVFGGDIDVRSFYFKPNVEGWPEKCRFTMTSFRPSLKFKHLLARRFYGEIQAGVAIKMSGRITSATKSHRYLDFDENPAMFLKATLSYSM